MRLVRSYCSNPFLKQNLAKPKANPGGRRDADLAFYKCCQDLRGRLR